MSPQRPGVVGGRHLPPASGDAGRLSRPLRLRGLEERSERCLGVDHDGLATRQPHDGIGPDGRAAVGAARHLRVEVDPREHARVLDHPPQLHLAPGASHVRRAQRPGQRAGLLSQRLLRPLHGQQLRVEPPPLHRALALELADVPLDPRQARGQGRQRERQLGVVLGRGAELGHPVGQQVALGDDGGVPCRGRGSHSPRGHPGTDGGTDEEAQEHRQHCFHASTVAACADNGPVNTPDTPGDGPVPPVRRPQNRWIAETGGTRGPHYARRFAELARSGKDVHGEADFVDGLLQPGSRVVDAGCGTGRVGIELGRRGHRIAGVDLDASMLAEARSAAPRFTWLEADLLEVDVAQVNGPADCVVMAGNVMVYLTPGTEPDVVGHLAGWLAPGGLLVAGFAADRHVGVDDYRGWCAATGLTEVSAHSGWDGSPLGARGGEEADPAYAVLVHRR